MRTLRDALDQTTLRNVRRKGKRMLTKQQKEARVRRLGKGIEGGSIFAGPDIQTVLKDRDMREAIMGADKETKEQWLATMRRKATDCRALAREWEALCRSKVFK